MVNYMNRTSNSGSLGVNCNKGRMKYIRSWAGAEYLGIVTDGGNDPAPTWRCLH